MNATAAAQTLWLDTVDSTNSEALRLWQSGARDPQWIVAAEQLAGRGRLDRQWVSRPGNLYATLLLPLAAPLRTLTQLSFVAALAVHQTCAQVCPTSAVTLKWPNDCLINGAKVAGILIETISSSPLAVAVGIGINVAHAPPAAQYPATCLATHVSASHAETDVASIFGHLSENMELWLSKWQQGRNFAELRGAWSMRSVPLSTPLQVRSGGRTMSGLFAGLGEDGELLLQVADGQIERIYAGDVMQVKEQAA